MFKRIRQTEFEKEDISIKDIRNICLEIASHDSKAHKLFDKSKIKSKYTKRINKMVEELEKAMNSGNLENVNKVFEKYNGIMDRYTKLKPNIVIKPNTRGGKEFFEFEETAGSGDISSLRRLYTIARQNTGEELEFQNEMKRRAKESEAREKYYEIEAQKREQKIIEANEKAERQRYKGARENYDNMQKFRTQLENDTIKDFEDIIKRQDNPSDINTMLKESKSRKRLDEIDGNSR